ncbi:exo-beta-N-acetylmuramidase NamZ family protein [Dysgonomonas capnocytophagoides]|uniref:exo-beta-N-acetylmuramidase NamZ family protein n=1 Tax=Dysgonomonas capnocytophagoides TaxID=45254 RepID=UPI00333E87DE
MKKGFLLSLVFLLLAFQIQAVSNIKVGADRFDKLLPLINNKRVALVVNHTSCLSNGTHLLDALISESVNVTKIFAPEHGFRGNADAGELIVNGKDPKTGLPVTSLYGRTKKPTSEMLQDVDVVIFDIQDVGARFYTYISTMHYVMEACAENDKPLIVLDRPNPHDYIDGPVLKPAYKSFVGMHPIPVLHGLTIGELAGMINGEGWLSGSKKCDLTVIKAEGWKHRDKYSLPIKPSPNLPNDQSISLYASLCFFEATNVSVGRGTYYPFQVIGYPDSRFGSFTFTPVALEGFDKNPLQKGKLCYGIDLRNEKFDQGLTLKYLIQFYKKSGQGTKFFKSPKFMNMLAGSDQLQRQIVSGMSESAIRKTWAGDLMLYKNKRKKYLLYED